MPFTEAQRACSVGRVPVCRAALIYQPRTLTKTCRAQLESRSLCHYMDSVPERSGHPVILTIPEEAVAFRIVSQIKHFLRNLAAVEELKPLAAKYGKTLPQLALRWTLSNPVIGTALVGFPTPPEVAENLGALGWEISNADMAEIDAVLARHGAVSVPSGWLED